MLQYSPSNHSRLGNRQKQTQTPKTRQDPACPNQLNNPVSIQQKPNHKNHKEEA